MVSWHFILMETNGFLMKKHWDNYGENKIGPKQKHVNNFQLSY